MSDADAAWRLVRSDEIFAELVVTGGRYLSSRSTSRVKTPGADRVRNPSRKGKTSGNRSGP